MTIRCLVGHDWNESVRSPISAWSTVIVVKRCARCGKRKAEKVYDDQRKHVEIEWAEYAIAALGDHIRLTPYDAAVAGREGTT